MEEYIIVSKQPSIVIVESSKIGTRLDAGNYRQDYLVNRDQIRHSAFGSKKLIDLLVKPSFRGRGFAENSSGKDPVIKVRNVTNYGITGPYDYTDATGISKSDRAWARKGDVLLTVTGLGSSGKADLYFSDTPMLIDGHIAILRCSSKCDAGFLKAFLSSSYGQKLSEQDTIGSTGQIELYGSYVDQFDIPYPDPKIQAYIGDKVRLAEKCREEANKCASLANQMLFDILGWPIEFMNEQSHFVDTKIVNDRLDPKYYQNKYLKTLKLIHNYVAGYVLLDQFVESISNGSEYREYSSDGIPYLTVGDISDGRLLWKKAPRIPSSAPISDRGKLKVHDVLVVRTGSIGQAAFVHHACKDAIISSHFIKLRLSSPRRAPWIAFFLNSTVGKILLERIAYGAIQPQIGQDELLRIPIPLIDLRYENEIARYWTSQILLKEISEDLITEAKLDVENLIEGKLNISSLQTDNQQTMQWETIDSNIQEKLAEYA